jgi:hypothetical protein
MATLVLLALSIAGFSATVFLLEAGFRTLRFVIAAAALIRERQAVRAAQPTAQSFTLQEARVR